MKTLTYTHARRRRQLGSTVAACLCLTLIAVSAKAAEISATLDPQDVALGESAELTVTVSGSRSTAPSISAVDGLDIESVGQSTQIQVINGATTAQGSYTYIVTPQRAGSFTIPAIRVGGAQSNPVTLRVGGGSAAQPPSHHPAQGVAPRSSLPPPSVNAQPGSVTAPADAKFGFLQIGLPKKQFYVGESMPVEVSAYFPDGLQASVTGLPVLSSEAFTLNQLEQKPTQTEQIVNGQRYTVLTWHSAISAVKAGDYSLSAQMPATVVVRERSRRSSGSLFDDFFDDPFFGRGTEKEITLHSEPDAMKVLALPTAGQPAGFGGAVGKFKVQATAAPTKVNVGDPITLTMKVSGTGNFDRISTEMLESTGAWKTYKPKSSFEPADTAGHQGTKTFEQIIMPNDPAVAEIPALSFSFFNPETQQYATVTTQAIPLQVTGTPAGNAASNAPTPTVRQTAAQSEDLLPNKMERERPVRSLRPVFLSPWYAPAQAVPLIFLLVALLYIRRRNRLATDPQFARTAAAERAIKAELDAMEQARRKRDALTFFIAARGALQQRLGERWGVKPASITVADVSARLNGEANGEANGVQNIFEMTDRIRFSPEVLEETDFREWKRRVVDELGRLKEKGTTT